MPNRAPLAEASVTEVGDVALVTIRNRRARIAKFTIEGVEGSPVKISITGNDSYRGSHTVTGDVVIRSTERGAANLYPDPPHEVK